VLACHSVDNVRYLTVKNKDLGVPSSKKAKNYLLTLDFPESRPIYWGPAQSTGFPTDYFEPDKDKWKTNEILRIPKVARFFYGHRLTSPDQDPCSPPPTPTEDKITIAEVRDHLPPYPYDFIIVWWWYVNGNRVYHDYIQSAPPGDYVLIGDTIVWMDYRPFYTVGLSFSGTPSLLPIRYVYNGVSGPGYYSGGVKLTPE